MDPFKVSIIKAEYSKNVFGGYSPTEHNSVTDYLSRNKVDHIIIRRFHIKLWLHFFSLIE